MCWLTDATLYEPSASNEPIKANITREVLDAMLDHDKAEETMDLLGWCHVFTVPEEWKRRFRIIEACHGVNDNTELEQRTVFTSIFERHAAVLNGKWVLDLDASAYYDQFPLAEEVRRYFGFMKNGRKYRMRVLPMGVKHAVWIAQTATRQLLNFDIPSSVYTEAYIDNVRFVSDSKDDLLNAAAMFCIRAGQVGVTLNEVKVSEFMKPFEDQSPDAMNRAIALAREELERKDLAVPRASWLGEFFDYEAKTVQMSEKSRQCSCTYPVRTTTSSQTTSKRSSPTPNCHVSSRKDPSCGTNSAPSFVIQQRRASTRGGRTCRAYPRALSLKPSSPRRCLWSTPAGLGGAPSTFRAPASSRYRWNGLRQICATLGPPTAPSPNPKRYIAPCAG